MIDDDSSLSATFYTQKSHRRYSSVSKSPRADDHSTQAMRWFILIAVFFGFLSSIAASVIIALITKNPLTAALPTSLTLTIRPIIVHFFPKDPKPK